MFRLFYLSFCWSIFDFSVLFDFFAGHVSTIRDLLTLCAGLQRFTFKLLGFSMFISHFATWGLSPVLPNTVRLITAFCWRFPLHPWYCMHTHVGMYICMYMYVYAYTYTCMYMRVYLYSA